MVLDIYETSVKNLNKIADANWKYSYLSEHGLPVKKGCCAGRFFQKLSYAFCCTGKRGCAPKPDVLHYSKAKTAITGMIQVVKAADKMEATKLITLIEKVTDSVNRLGAIVNHKRRAVPNDGKLFNADELIGDDLRQKLEKLVAEKDEARLEQERIAAIANERGAAAIDAPALEPAQPVGEGAAKGKEEMIDVLQAEIEASDIGEKGDTSGIMLPTVKSPSPIEVPPSSHIHSSSSDDEAILPAYAAAPRRRQSRKHVARANALVASLNASSAEDGMVLRSGRKITYKS
ncbi:MAG: hypothetical protein JWO53_299 [Chlamydiia bacterium]|nr:hypothetical protein [Chlamydiia bacterium]